mgnify:CR=1 FL=1
MKNDYAMESPEKACLGRKGLPLSRLVMLDGMVVERDKCADQFLESPTWDRSESWNTSGMVDWCRSQIESEMASAKKVEVLERCGSDVLPFLTDSEVFSMCDPLTQPSAQCRWLKRQGVDFKIKPNGRPLVSRAGVFQAAEGASKGEGANPDVEALLLMFKARKK